MKEFEVTITETLQKTVTVEAESREEAEKQANDLWSDGEIVLDADDFADVEFHSDEGKEIGEKEIIDVLMVEPGRYPRTDKIGSDLKSMQKAVGGIFRPHISSTIPWLWSAIKSMRYWNLCRISRCKK